MTFGHPLNTVTQSVSKTRDYQIPVTDKLYYSGDSCFCDTTMTYASTVHCLAATIENERS